MFQHDAGSGWRLPVGASLCGVVGYGSPMHMDFFGGHTTGSVAFSAAAVGVFLAAAVWMFRRWGGAAGGGTHQPVTLTEDESEALWAELEGDADDASGVREQLERARPV